MGNQNRITLSQIETSERFFKIPKIFNDRQSIYFKLSVSAKYAYGLLRDRYSLSVKHPDKFVDSEGAVFQIFTIEELSALLGCSRDKTIAIKKELTECRLIEEERTGRANHIYLLNVNLAKVPPLDKLDKTLESSNADVGKSLYQKSEKPMSEKSTSEVGKSDSSETERVRRIDDDKNKKAPARTDDSSLNQLMNDYQRNFSATQALSEKHQELLESMINRFGAVLVGEALRRVRLKNGGVGLVRNPLAYMRKILEDWSSQKLTTLDEINAYDPFLDESEVVEKSANTNFYIPLEGPWKVKCY